MEAYDQRAQSLSGPRPRSIAFVAASFLVVEAGACPSLHLLRPAIIQAKET